MTRKKSGVHPKEKIEKLHLRLDELEKELDNVMQTGIPQKYWRLQKEKKEKESKLRWMRMWHG